MSEKKLYLFKIKLRGQTLWCHASSWDDAVEQFTKQTNEPIEDYGLEWSIRNLDGTLLDYATYDRICNGTGFDMFGTGQPT